MILVYADIDLNLIDGSAVWLASLTEMLSLDSNIHVHVLLKAPLTETRLVREIINKQNIAFIDPWAMNDNFPIRRSLSQLNGSHLNTEIAASIISIISRDLNPNKIIIRGKDLLYRLSGDPEISNKMIAYITNPPSFANFSDLQRLISIHQNSALTLLQTNRALKSFSKLLKGNIDRSKIDILNPMVPDGNFKVPITRNRISNSLGYSGKFSPPYMIEEMLNAFSVIFKHKKSASFHVVGDKIHNNPYVDGFEERVKENLHSQPGVTWYGGVSREKANELMSRVTVASGWRDASFDDTVEISTKILEYAALGTPVLMRPAPVQIDVFGGEMPTWVKSEIEFIQKFNQLNDDYEYYTKTAELMREAVREYSMSSTISRLRKYFVKE